MIIHKPTIGIWGFGIVGTSALKFFTNQGHKVSVIDNRTLSSQEHSLIESLGATYWNYKDLQAFLEHHDLILPSPGIDLRPYAAMKAKLIAELDIFGKHFTKPIIAITGTIGKTSTTQLLSHILKSHGLRVATGGNVGIGMLDLLAEQYRYDIAVLEVSSFQLELCKTFAPHVGLWTNFFPNHLDRHSSLQEYFNAKHILFNHQTSYDYAIAPFSIAKDMHHIQAQQFFITAQDVDDNLLNSINDSASVFFIRNNHIIRYHCKKIENLISIDHMPLATFIENTISLIAVLYALKVPLHALQASSTFINERHRLEKVATFNTIDVYNDSKSTIPQATIAAVNKLQGRPIILLLGGLSKGVNRTSMFQELTHKVYKIICFGSEATLLHQHALMHGLDSYSCATLEQACEHAFASARPGDQIVLSPSGSSFDLFKNYQERGNAFKALVDKYHKGMSIK